MKKLVWYFDFISPFAYLQWPHMRELADKHEVEFRPILLAGLLNHWGSKGPAEIPSKRDYTYRYVTWLALRKNTPLRLPPAHPFNPLPALRMAIAQQCSPEAIEAIFEHIWRDGRSADTPLALQPVAQRLGIENIERLLNDPTTKQILRDNTNAAIAANVFGVPTTFVDGQLFFGEDSTAMLDEFLQNPQLFESEEYLRLGSLPQTAQR